MEKLLSKVNRPKRKDTQLSKRRNPNFLHVTQSKLSGTHKYYKTVNFLSQPDGSAYHCQASKVTTVLRYCIFLVVTSHTPFACLKISCSCSFTLIADLGLSV